MLLCHLPIEMRPFITGDYYPRSHALEKVHPNEDISPEHESFFLWIYPTHLDPLLMRAASGILHFYVIALGDPARTNSSISPQCGTVLLILRPKNRLNLGAGCI